MEFNFLGIINMPSNVRKRRYGKMPLRVGLWSWTEDEGRKTLHHDVAHYRETYSPHVWGKSMIRDAQAEALIRKLHRADYVGWTMDNTGESSELAVIDERLREQIEIVMRDCRIDPGPAPPNPALLATHHETRIAKHGLSAAGPSQEAVTARAPHRESRHHFFFEPPAFSPSPAGPYWQAELPAFSLKQSLFEFEPASEITNRLIAITRLTAVHHAGPSVSAAWKEVMPAWTSA